MKAQLALENVGGIEGEKDFVLRSGVLNVIESPNALGKSTLIKGIAAALSLPVRRPLTQEVAHRMGIKNMRPGLDEPLVNIHATSANLTIEMGNERIRLEMTKDGNVRINPKGDDTFLLTSILTRESEVVRRLIDGESNFEWIVDNASLAEQYTSASTIVEKWLTTAQLQLEEINQKADRIEELRNEENRLIQMRSNIEHTIKDLEKELKKLPKKDPRLDERWNRLRLQKEKFKEKQDQIQSNIESLRKEAAPKEQQIKALEQTVSKIEKRLGEIQTKIANLPSKTEIETWQEEIEKIEKVEKPELDRHRFELEGQIKLFDNALSLTSENQPTTCFLCEEGTLTPQKIKSRREEIRNDKREIEKQISKLVSRRNELFGRLNKTGRDEKSLSEELDFVKSQYGRENSRLDRLRIEIKSNKAEIEQKKIELKSTLSEMEKINRELDSVERKLATLGDRENKLIEKLGKHRNELEKVTEDINQIKENIIDRSTSYLEEIPINVNQAKVFLSRWIEDLEEAFDYLLKKADDQKKLACRQFNKNIKDLLRKLRFTGFEDIWINEETFELSVLRKAGKGAATQTISSLSTSEKYVIATIMQIAMKGAYSPDNPFFIIDEVILDFDDKRTSAIMDYLREVAQRNDWYLILARLGEQPGLEIRYMD